MLSQSEFNQITQGMLALTRPVVTPLTSDDVSTEHSKPHLIGSGTYAIDPAGFPIILTCEHVARVRPMHFRFLGNGAVWQTGTPWCTEKYPIDLACAPVDNRAWESQEHQSAFVPYDKLASRHSIARPDELLFFCGFSKENQFYWSSEHTAYGSGYLTNEVQRHGDDRYFELFWDPTKTQFTEGTNEEARANVRFEEAGGFSGSLVWNTRFFEVTSDGGTWTPDDARVTGMLHRWDQETKSLLALRVEHLRCWLEGSARYGADEFSENAAR